MTQTRTRGARLNIRTITMHKAVSHANCGILPMQGGLGELVRLRRLLSCDARAKANRREDAPFAARFERQHGPGSAWDAGKWTLPTPPRKLYIINRVLSALAAGDLPDDLATFCTDYLDESAVA